MRSLLLPSTSDGPAPEKRRPVPAYADSPAEEPASNRRDRPRRGGLVAYAAGLVLVVAVVGWQGYVTAWNAHSSRVGHALVEQARARQAAANQVPSAPCVAPASDAGPTGLLEIPSIDLVAPVLQGTDDAQLSVAVGHLGTSVLPGQAGTAVLEAHDVSYFVHIDRLRPGDVVRYEAPCTTYEFTVSGSQVVQQGAPVYNTPTPTLVLATCWPTDALWFTPQRYLVTATESAVVQGTSASPTPAAASSAAPSVPAPAGLVAEGLTLATNSVPMGAMTISGTPDLSWVQSPGPLAVESSAVQAFIGGVRSATEDRADWWRAIAPGVPLPAPLVGARVDRYPSGLAVEISTAGSTPTAVLLTTTVVLAGGSSPGLYSETVTTQVAAGVLTITGWTLEPA